MFGRLRASYPSRRIAATRFGRVLLVSGVVVFGVLYPPVGFAQDIDDEPVSSEGAAEVFTLTLGEVGLGESLRLQGVDGRVQITVPVPTGVVPRALNATLTVPPWLDRGWIDVESNDRPIFRIDLSGDAQTVPVSIPLGAAAIVGGAVTLEFSSTLIPDAGYCPVPSGDPVRIIDAAVDYSGVPAIPRTISEFLPPVLRQLTVFVPAEPGPDVIDAVLTLTTSVTESFGAQNVRMVVRPDTDLRSAPPSGPFDRTVVLSDNTDAGAELIFPVPDTPPQLYITGTGSELLDQTRLITSPVADLAVTRGALAGPRVPPAVLATNSTTFDALDIGTVTGAPTASVALDQTRLGRSAADVSVHLTGSYTPGAGSLTATIGDRTLAVWTADDTGRLDQWIDIPNAELDRITTLDVTVSRSSEGSGSACGAQSASTVTIDGASVIESSDSASPVPLGFGSLPQALTPRVGVALAENSFVNTVRAVSLVNGLQRMSTRLMQPHVVEVDEALNGTEPAIVIAPDGNLPDTLELPVSSNGAATLSVTATDTSGSETLLTLDTAVPFGTVQVASNPNGAALMVASSNGAPAQLDDLIAWLDAGTNRWFGLSGDVLFGTPGAEPLTLSSNDLTGPQTDTAAQSQTSNKLVVFFAGVGVVLILSGLIVAAIIVVRSRRRSQRGNGPVEP